MTDFINRIPAHVHASDCRAPVGCENSEDNGDTVIWRYVISACAYLHVVLHVRLPCDIYFLQRLAHNMPLCVILRAVVH